MRTFTQASPAVSSGAGSPIAARPRAGRLVALRIAWILVVAWMLATFALSLPGQIHTFEHPSPRSSELAPAAVAALLHLGISLDVYAWAAVVLGSVVMLVATALAFMLFWRRGDDWMVLLVALLFPAFCLQSIGPSESFHTAPTGSPLAVANVVLLSSASFAIIYAVFMLFPGGRFVPSWSWTLVVLCVAWIAAFNLVPSLTVLYLGYPLFLGAAVACQIYRYRQVSSPVQRQQTRWAVFGLVTALLANQAFWLTAGFAPLAKTAYPPLAYLALYGSVLLLPVTFFIAIQRHRLYEIDVLINRVLVYGTLTAILAGLYFAVVVGSQAVIQHLTGQSDQQPFVIVGTTLLVAALFTPLRRRIQAGIDRAFYRSRYDATRTLAEFAAQMRMETDLDALSAHVVLVVQRTMQPAHVTLWLRTPTRHTEDAVDSQGIPYRPRAGIED